MRNRLAVALLVLAAFALARTASGAPMTPVPGPVKPIRLIITKPAAGAMYPIGSRVRLAWNAAAIKDPWFSVYLFDVNAQKRGGALQIQNSGTNEGWLVSTQDKLGTYYYGFESYGGKPIARSGTFEVVAGIIQVTAPAAGQSLEIGKPFTIRWNAESLKQHNVVTVWLRVFSMKTQTAGGPYPVRNTGSFDWTPTSADKGQTKILIASDGDKFKGESGIFTIGFRLQPGTVTKRP